MPAVSTDMTPTNSDESGEKLRLLTFDSLDMRTNAAKRALKARDELISRAGMGGREDSVAHQMATRTIFLNLILEDVEARMLKGEAVDQDKYLSLANCHRRAIEALGVLNSEPIPKTEESAKTLAKSILDIIHETGGADVARLIDLNSDESGSQPAPALNEGTAFASGGVVPSFSPPAESSDIQNFSAPENQDAEKFPNGASVEHVRMNGSGNLKWAIRDSGGHIHGFRPDRAAAVAFAESLPDSFPVQPEPEEEEVSE